MKIFYLPDLGEGLAEAEIREWYIKVGDEVQIDQPLVSMETAKAIVDVPSPYTGKIVALHGEADSIIKTGAPFITFETAASSHHQDDQGSVVGRLEATEKEWQDGAVTIGAPKAKIGTVKALPAARVLASQWEINLAQIAGTGPQGLITAEDVKQHIDKNHCKPSQKCTGEKEALHGVRRMMAQVMSDAHRAVAPVTIFEDADITDLTVTTDITIKLLKAIAAACKIEPALNAWFEGESLERKLFSEVHIGIAIDTAEGLFVPVIKNVETHSEQALRRILNDYKKTVLARTIAMSAMQGATITLSNFGTIAGRYATPIIVPPTVAILGCGRYREQAIVRAGKVVVGRVMPLSLSVDHRAVTGGEASRFLKAVINQLL